MDTLLQDLRYAVRSLRRSPGFTAVVVLTLALGIGANTAIFSVVNGVLLTPLPYRDPGRLVMVWESKGSQTTNVVNPANYLRWKDRAASFSDLAAFTWSDLVFTGDRPEDVQGRAVSPEFFRTLALAPVVGRGFTPEEQRPGGPRVIVISEGLWRRRFGADSGVVGRTVPVPGGSVRVVGVMPRSLQPLPWGDEEFWEPLRLDPSSEAILHGRYLQVVGRLKDGVDLGTARAEIQVIAAGLEHERPDFDTGWSANIVSLTEQFVGGARRMLLVLLGAVSMVLLIACANVANLMLARASARDRELAVRAALGASRWRLIRQGLAESVLLAIIGGGAGLLLAWWGVDALVAAKPGAIPRLSDVGLDARVYGFACAVSLVVGIVFGLPAALGRWADRLERRRGETARTTAGLPARRLRGGLVVAQVALAIVLLVGAGLLVRSLRRLVAVDPGFDPAHLVMVNFSLPQGTYGSGPDARQNAFYERLLGRVRGLPGVQAAGAIDFVPMTPIGAATSFQVVGRSAPRPGQSPTADIRDADPGYFGTMRIALKRGRLFTGSDAASAPHVAVINETLAREQFPGEDPIGHGLRISWGDSLATVIGVVADVRTTGLDAARKAMIYFPLAQSPVGSATLVMRSEADLAALASGVRVAAREIDPDMPVGDAVTMYTVLARSMSDRRYPMALLVLLAGLAVTLSAIGIYGVLSYTVGMRTREIGVRMALGAAPADVLRNVIRGGLVLTLWGVAIGSVAAAFAARALSALLFGVKPLDPITFLLVGALLVAVALLAMALPARRAARTDPMIALRSE